MGESVSNYKCPACGGGLTFDAEKGIVVCEYCGSKYDVSQMEQMYPGTGESSASAPSDGGMAGLAGDSPSADVDAGSFDGGGSWDTSGLNGNWGEDAAKMKEYSCPSCGGVILCEQTTAATSCPYCGNPTVVETQFAGSLRPDYIIPFKFKKEKAVQCLERPDAGGKGRFLCNNGQFPRFFPTADCRQPDEWKWKLASWRS